MFGPTVSTGIPIGVFRGRRLSVHEGKSASNYVFKVKSSIYLINRTSWYAAFFLEIFAMEKCGRVNDR